MAKRKKLLNPVPRWKNNAWHVVWRWDNKQYSISTGLSDQENNQKDAELFASEMKRYLAMESPKFPNSFYASKGLERYMLARYGSMYPGEDAVNRDSRLWIANYEAEMRQECIGSWVDTNISMLKALEENLGSLDKVTTKKLSAYLAELTEKTSIPTRNRKRNAFSRFYKWAVRTKRTHTNPIAEIPVLTESRITDIVYCTPAERDRIIQLAHQTGMMEWIAVPIAFYGGMRREEIAKLKWTGCPGNC